MMLASPPDEGCIDTPAVIVNQLRVIDVETTPDTTGSSNRFIALVGPFCTSPEDSSHIVTHLAMSSS